MANVLGLALRITGDASGLRLDPAERALQRLGTEADKVGKIFDQFAATTSAAADAQLATRTKFEQLANSLRAQEISAQDYAKAFAQLKAEAQATAAVFDRGARTTAQFATEQERSATAIGKFAEELRLGAIEAPTFERALTSLAGVDLTGTEEGRRQLAAFAQQAQQGTLDIDAAARSLQSLAAEQTRIQQIFADGARTTAQFTSEQDRAVVSLTKLVDQFSVGAIESKTFEQAISAAFGVDLGASDDIAASVREIANAVATGNGSVEQYAETLRNLAEQQRSAAAAEEERQQLQNRANELVRSLVTGEQQRAEAARELENLRRTGLLTDEQYASLLQRIGPITEEARQAESALAADRNRARQIIESLLTPQERYQQSVAQLDQLLGQNLINQEQYNRALQQAQAALDSASGASAAAAEAEARRVASQREGAAITASVQTAEERRAERIADLDRLLGENAITQETYNRAIDEANGVQEAAARAEAELRRVRDEGRRITEQFATVEERRSQRLEELNRLLDAGAITQETFERASREASGANEAAARAERERADALAAASRIIQANITPQERYDAAIVELRGHLEAGRLSQDQFNRATERARQDLDRSTVSARSNDQALQGISRQLRLISSIEIGRLVVDGFQLLANVVRSATSQIESLISGVRQSLDEIDKLSLRTGISREALQGYGVAAELAGVSTDELGATFQRLAANIGRANPPAELTQGLRQLNLNVQQLRGLAPEDQFALIAQRISELPTATQRAGAAFGVLGEQGVRLTSLLQQQGNAIEEVRQRSERLGIIVSDQQIANVTQLNDTFTLVSRTIQGIVGQITGNLAPIVNAIAEEFLAFVEGFEGVESTGGTALAERITDSLLTGAEFLAGVFDFAVASFAEFSVTLSDVGEVFSRAVSGLEAVIDVAQGLFALQDTRNQLTTLGVSKLLEQIGRIPFLSDLSKTGEALADAAFERLEDNAERFANSVDSAVVNAGEAIFGETPAEAGERGAGAAEQYIANFRAKLEESRSPEFRVNTNIQATRDAFDDFFGGLIDQSSRVTDLMRDFEAAVTAAQEDATLTAEEIATIEDLQKRINAAIQEELAARGEAIAAANKQAEADAKRVDSLLQTSDASQKIIEDLATVEREIARVQQQIADAGAGDNGTAEARLRELQTLQTQLDDQLQAAAQGFDQGFAAAFDSVGQRFNGLAERAAEFGDAGVAAAARLQEGIALAQQQAEDGILNREAFDAEVARRERLFEQEIERVREVAQERQRINELVDQRFLLARFGGDQQRLDAARNLAALEAEIGRVQQEVQAARAAGDQAAVNAGIARLGQLDQVAAQERDIATGRRQLEEQLAEQRDQYLEQLQQQQEQAQQEQQKFLEEQRKAIEAEQQRQAERIRELNTLGSGVIEGNDIRTAEGAALFLQLAANRQDPALIEARLQTRRLTEIRQEVRALVEGLTGLPVLNIAGGAG